VDAWVGQLLSGVNEMQWCFSPKEARGRQGRLDTQGSTGPVETFLAVGWVHQG
jgi:hypothetical protein